MIDKTLPLSEIIKKLLAASPAKSKAPPKAQADRSKEPAGPTERETRLQRIVSQRWKEEQLILLVTRVRCECGELYSSPHPRMFIRRYHPQFGVHMEPLVVRPHSPMIAASPPIVEFVDECASICHRCLPVRSAAALSEANQMAFDFSLDILQNLPFLNEHQESVI